MDETLATKFAALDLYDNSLTENHSHVYEAKYNEIVAFADKTRAADFFPGELCVTRELAEPFTYGGLMIILQEPRKSHPWVKGIQAVISDCPTLSILDEGLSNISGLSLTCGVSVLDARPFFNEEIDKLNEQQWHQLKYLVFQAIDAKRPDVLLLMGTVAKQVVDRRKKLNCSPKIIQSYHPSYYLRRMQRDPAMYQAIFDTLRDACKTVTGNRNLPKLWDVDPGQVKTTCYTAEPGHGLSNPSRSIIYSFGGFLKTLIKLSLNPDDFLPRPNILPRPYATLARSMGFYCNQDLSQIEHDLSNTGLPRAVVEHKLSLLPLIEQMNSCYERDSNFLPGYTIKWVEAQRCLIEQLDTRIEKSCYYVAYDGEQTESMPSTLLDDHSLKLDEESLVQFKCRMMIEITKRVDLIRK
ncbi:hypothetical protein BT63DRAFT_443179 [Microthyrium microscopicum]|uniref:Uracil-DNA glycosylase-like domain-containing protein n=1 Tax=Microthyrium microscopicum TaxID=703497 RepID=A0A6A6TXP1_9PEZI|nr:hypothetical protein BT63DRAFT_443179 [Microthyrium microscopicum]